MPLHLTWECCKCKRSGSQSLWAIRSNHSYSDTRYVCSHFSIRIDTVSKIRFFGIGWSNHVELEVTYKNNWTRSVIDQTFNTHFMEYQNSLQFDNVVFHARVSDYKGNYPTCGYSLQNEIEYNERMEQQKKEQEEKRKKYQRDIKLKLDKLFQEEMEEKKKQEEKKEEEKKRENKISRKKNRLFTRQKLTHINYDLLFSEMKEIRIAKSA